MEDDFPATQPVAEALVEAAMQQLPEKPPPSKKRKRELTGPTPDRHDRAMVKRFFSEAVDEVHDLGIEFPNGLSMVQEKMLTEVPDHYFVVVRRTEGNYAISQPASHCYVEVWRDYFLFGFPKHGVPEEEPARELVFHPVNVSKQ